MENLKIHLYLAKSIYMFNKLSVADSIEYKQFNIE